MDASNYFMSEHLYLSIIVDLITITNKIQINNLQIINNIQLHISANKKLKSYFQKNINWVSLPPHGLGR